MKLSQFVTDTLTEIIEGVSRAQQKLDDSGREAGALGASVNPELRTSDDTVEAKGYRVATTGALVQNVDFDVAVTVSEDVEAQAGVGILVAVIGLGAKGKVATENVAINRIKFQVQVALPRQASPPEA